MVIAKTVSRSVAFKAYMRLGQRISPLGKVFLIGDIQVSVTSYILQISPVVSNHSDVFEIRITGYKLKNYIYIIMLHILNTLPSRTAAHAL